MNISGSMLSSIKAAESNLARQENIELERIAKGFPDDHPISDEYKKLKASTGGDLSTLPSNHPFIMTMKDVQRQINASANPAEAERQEDERHDVHEQKIQKRKQAEREQRIKDEEDRGIRRMASQQVNIQIDKVEQELKKLYAISESVLEELSGDQYTRTKANKLTRTMAAMSRALQDCKINTTRMR